MLGHQNYLVLQKSEWDRIGRKHTDTEDQQRDEYFRALNEQSQIWIKHWPDTVQGHVHQLKKQKKIEQAKQVEMVKQFALKKKHENTADVINKARALIFADSCYGRQLLSALLASKTLEERDLQLKLQNELTKQAYSLKVSEPISLSLLDSIQMEVNETTARLKNKQRALEVAKCNKAMFDMQTEKRMKEREEMKLELEDMSVTQHETKKNAEIELIRSHIETQAIKGYEMQNRDIKDFRVIREKQDECRREIWRKYQDRVRCREKTVFDKIHKERYDSSRTQEVFKTIKNIEENKKKQYDEFVQKGIEHWLVKSQKQEQDSLENKMYIRNERKTIDEQNKMQAELQSRRKRENSKCTCCRQCIITKCSDTQKQKTDCTKGDVSTFAFLSPKNKHLEALKKRQARPSAWNALNAAHVQFSVRASETLKECRYKNAARKVVDEYRRINCLDQKSLPVSNYY